MKNGIRLWLSLSIRVTIIMFVMVSIAGTLSSRFFSSDIHSVTARLFPLISLLIAAILVSISLIFIVSKRLLAPIQNLIEALQRVAKGNFTVRLPESHEDAYAYDMNANFNKMTKELSSTEMLQPDFIRNVSHEFKAPLTFIEGHATLLDGVSLPGEFRIYSGHIFKSAQQLSVLAGSILKISKLENQGIVSQKKFLFLDEQVRQALLSLTPMWEPKNLDIDMNLPETLYYGGENLILQVWTNPFLSAARFAPSGGSVSVRRHQTPEVIQMCIEDAGASMVPEIQSHIFDKFYQGEQNRDIEGNGPGLVLVKKIVTLCNGTVVVESRPGEGSAFTVRPPMGKQ